MPGAGLIVAGQAGAFAGVVRALETVDDDATAVIDDETWTASTL